MTLKSFPRRLFVVVLLLLNSLQDSSADEEAKTFCGTKKDGLQDGAITYIKHKTVNTKYVVCSKFNDAIIDGVSQDCPSGQFFNCRANERTTLDTGMYGLVIDVCIPFECDCATLEKQPTEKYECEPACDPTASRCPPGTKCTLKTAKDETCGEVVCKTRGNYANGESAWDVKTGHNNKAFPLTCVSNKICLDANGMTGTEQDCKLKCNSGNDCLQNQFCKSGSPNTCECKWGYKKAGTACTDKIKCTDTGDKLKEHHNFEATIQEAEVIATTHTEVQCKADHVVRGKPGLSAIKIKCTQTPSASGVFKVTAPLMLYGAILDASGPAICIPISELPAWQNPENFCSPPDHITFKYYQRSEAVGPFQQGRTVLIRCPTGKVATYAGVDKTSLEIKCTKASGKLVWVPVAAAGTPAAAIAVCEDKKKCEAEAGKWKFGKDGSKSEIQHDEDAFIKCDAPKMLIGKRKHKCSNDFEGRDKSFVCKAVATLAKADVKPKENVELVAIPNEPWSELAALTVTAKCTTGFIWKDKHAVSTRPVSVEYNVDHKPEAEDGTLRVYVIVNGAKEEAECVTASCVVDTSKYGADGVISSPGKVFAGSIWQLSALDAVRKECNKGFTIHGNAVVYQTCGTDGMLEPATLETCVANQCADATKCPTDGSAYCQEHTDKSITCFCQNTNFEVILESGEMKCKIPDDLSTNCAGKCEKNGVKFGDCVANRIGDMFHRDYLKDLKYNCRCPMGRSGKECQKDEDDVSVLTSVKDGMFGSKKSCVKFVLVRGGTQIVEYNCPLESVFVISNAATGEGTCKPYVLANDGLKALFATDDSCAMNVFRPGNYYLPTVE